MNLANHPQTPSLPPEEILPLEPGDRLTRDEFERRYEAMPHLKKAELIEGVVYMPSPVRHRRHGRPHAQIMGWLIAYEAATPGVEASDNSTARLDLGNEPQPDALLLIDPARGGQARLSPDDYIVSAPELVAEIAASSAAYELDTKLEVYRRNGVREYIVWRVREGQIDWFVLRQDRYDRLSVGPDAIVRSEVFPGLWLDVEALLGGDLARVLAVVRQGMTGAEHADFVLRLQRPPASE